MSLAAAEEGDGQGRTIHSMARELISAFTIDGPKSLDLDDAIGVETTDDGWIVHVSIADVAHFVEPGSSRDRRARERAFTRYLPDDKNKPMLPRVLSEGEGSLLPGDPRPALTVSIPLDAGFVPGVPVIRRTFVRNTHKLSYAQADEIAGQPDHPLHRDMRLCQRIARGLLEARMAAGALALFDIERGLVIAEDGRLRPLDEERRHHACMVIQEFMVLTNATVARALAERGQPALYRNHKALATAPSRDSLLADLRHSVLDPRHFPPATLDQKLSLVLGRASYGPQIEGHYALNLPAYVHFTSPLRRYADLVCHRVLLAALEEAPPPCSVDELEAIATHINALQDVERDKRRAGLRERARQAADEAGTTSALVRRIENPSGPPDEREQLLLARLRKQEVEAVHVYRLLFARWRKAAEGSPRLLQAALKVLYERPEMAVSVLQMAHQDLHWPLPETVVEQDGQPHAPTFVARLSLQTPERVAAAEGRHTTKKGSVQQASVALLADLVAAPPLGPASPMVVAGDASSVGDPVATEDVAPPSRLAAEKRALEPAVRDPGNAKGRLLELCQARAWPQPRYSVAQSGPPHAPIFTVVAELAARGQLWRSQPGVGPNRKAAEQAASFDLLETLMPLEAPPSAPAHTADHNPVGWLQEACQKAGRPLPIYQDRPCDNGFEVRCRVEGPDGQVIETVASAARKADARKTAAAEAAARWRG